MDAIDQQHARNRIDTVLDLRVGAQGTVKSFKEHMRSLGKVAKTQTAGDSQDFLADIGGKGI